MALLVLLLLFALLGLFALILTMPPQKGAALLTSAGPITLIAVGGVLTLLRRGVIGVPLILLGLSWLRRSRSMRSPSYSGGGKSTVRSACLEMELDHDTGEMDGWVLTGRMKGTQLSSLNEAEVLSLYQEISYDADSAALLESYLDRRHPGWRENSSHNSSRGTGGETGSEFMTREEAYQILGLEPGASQEQIHQAWRRLVKAVHPDSGGSKFLTAKINAARDLLLK